MGDPVVVALHGTADLLVSRIVADRGIIESVAIAVVAHIADHICLIMTDVYGLGVSVAGRVISPVPGRAPWVVMRPQKVCVDYRPYYEYGLDDKGRTINVRCADNLDVAGGTDAGNLGDQGRNVLIHIGSQHCLDNENVGSAVHGLDDTQIIHISVLVEIEIGEHV